MLKFWRSGVCSLAFGGCIFISFYPVLLRISLMANLEGLSAYPKSAVFISMDE